MTHRSKSLGPAVLPLALVLAVVTAPEAQINPVSETASAQQGSLKGMLLVPHEARPARSVPDRPVLLSIGPTTIERDQEIGGLIAIGPVRVRGKVKGDVVCIGGKVALEGSATVAGRVTAVCAPVEKADGATVVGGIQANAIPRARDIEVGWPGLRTGMLFIGTTRVEDAEPHTGIMILGGDGVVAKAAKVTEVTVIGGDLTVEEGADVKVARVVGGKLQRSGKPSPQDAVLAPLVVDIVGAADALGEAELSTSQSAQEVGEGLYAKADLPSSGPPTLAIYATGERSGFSLNLIAWAAVRTVRERTLGPAGTGGDDWHWDYNGLNMSLRGVYVPEAAQPALVGSTALAIGLSVAARVTDDGRRTGERRVSIAIPTEAAKFVRDWATLHSPSTLAPAVSPGQHPGQRGGYPLGNRGIRAGEAYGGYY